MNRETQEAYVRLAGKPSREIAEHLNELFGPFEMTQTNGLKVQIPVDVLVAEIKPIIANLIVKIKEGV